MRAANLALSVTEIREAEDRYIAKGSPPPAERTGFVKLHLTTWQLGDVGRDPPRVLRRQRDEGGKHKGLHRPRPPHAATHQSHGRAYGCAEDSGDLHGRILRKSLGEGIEHPTPGKQFYRPQCQLGGRP